MKEEKNTNNIGKVFIIIFILNIITNYIVYWLFGFEIAILYSISLATAIISMTFSGLENIILNKK